jgi:hypothetical protein
MTMHNLKYARVAGSPVPYVCRKKWGKDCSVKCGSDSLSLNSDDLNKKLKKIIELDDEINISSRTVAFFEAYFNMEPSCVIRGEGKTIEEAEVAAYRQYRKILTCHHFELDRRGRADGFAYCKACPYYGMILYPLTNCHTCDLPACYKKDLAGNWYCEEDYYQLDIDLVCGKKVMKERISPSSVNEKRRSFFYGQIISLSLVKLGYKYETKKYEKMKRILTQHITELYLSNVFQKNMILKLDDLNFMNNHLNLPYIKSIILKVLTKYPELTP